MLKDIIIDVGIGLGLFAIFSILRFRTRNFSIKDMAYIFTTIGISVINTVSKINFPVIGFIIINILIVLSVFVLKNICRKTCIINIRYLTIILIFETEATTS
jgi:hypothetical protein